MSDVSSHVAWPSLRRSLVAILRGLTPAEAPATMSARTRRRRPFSASISVSSA